MKSIDLLKGMNDIDDKYIEEAIMEAAPKPKVSLFRKYYVLAGVAAAACVVALSARAFKVSKSSMSSYEMAEEAADESYDMADEAASESAMVEEAEEAPAAAEESFYEGTPAMGSDALDNAADSTAAGIAADRNADLNIKPEAEKYKSGDGSTQIANPWRDSTQEEIGNITGRDFNIPKDAVDEYFLLMNDSLAEMDCGIHGRSVTARMEKRTDFADISGANYDWTKEYDLKIKGNNGKIYIFGSENENVAVCLFSDGELMYSLMVSGEEPINTTDLTDLVYQIWDL